MFVSFRIFHSSFNQLFFLSGRSLSYILILLFWIVLWVKLAQVSLHSLIHEKCHVGLRYKTFSLTRMFCRLLYELWAEKKIAIIFIKIPEPADIQAILLHQNSRKQIQCSDETTIKNIREPSPTPFNRDFPPF